MAMANPVPQRHESSPLNEQQPSSEPQQPAETVKGYKVPLETDYVPPAFPGRPNLFEEVELGPLPTKEDIQTAYRVWELQDGCLALPVLRGRAKSRSNGASSCLVRNVYETLMEDSFLPSDTCNKAEQYRATDDGGSLRGWSYEEIFGPDAEGLNFTPERQPASVSLHGHDILTDRYWTKPKLQAELRRRNLNANGLVASLRQSLYEDEVRNTEAAGQDVDKGSLLPRQDLSDWGIPRKDNHMLKISTQKELSPLDMYTWAILLSPYNPAYWTSRAFLYYQMGYHDLAVGDAYRAQLLCEILVNPLSRNRQPGLYIRIWDAIERHILQIPRTGDALPVEVQTMRKSNGINSFIPDIRKCVHHIISLSLLAMKCWEDYTAAEPYLRTRLAMPDRDANAVRQREGRLREFIENSTELKRNNELEYLFERHYGYIPAQPYPYEADDIMPATDLIAKRMDKGVLSKSQSTTFSHRQFKIDIDDLKQVCAFATEDIPAGSIIYCDEPSIRGHLQSDRAFPHARLCENCKREVQLSNETTDHFSQSFQPNGETFCRCSQSITAPVFWCPRPSSTVISVEQSDETKAGERNDPPRKKRKISHDLDSTIPSCLEIAKSLYHNKVCGKDWTWLHDAMRPNYWESIGLVSGQQRLSHTNEKHGTILSLLLREVFDITLLRRETAGKPNLLAHEIDELIPIILDQAQDDPSLFPFSFAANVRVPFDILSCLGVNIFRDLTFDTWVIQLVLRKLLMAVVPWYSEEDEGRDEPETQAEKNRRTERIRDLVPDEFPDVNPSLPDLYVFPILSMFRNRCLSYHNVDWFWDRTVPNRIILQTVRDIKAKEELFIGRSKSHLTRDERRRILGKPCSCYACVNELPYPEDTPPTDHYGDVSKSVSPEAVVELSEPSTVVASDDSSDIQKEEPQNRRASTSSPAYQSSPVFNPVMGLSDLSESEEIDEDERGERAGLHEMARQIGVVNYPMYPGPSAAVNTSQQALGAIPRTAEHPVPGTQAYQAQIGHNSWGIPPYLLWNPDAALGQGSGPAANEEAQPPRRGPRIRFRGRSVRGDEYNQTSPGTRDRERAEYLRRQREE